MLASSSRSTLKKEKRRARAVVLSHIFLTSGTTGTQTTASNLHSSWPARANSQKSKQNDYIYPFKQTKNVATALQYWKERKEIVIRTEQQYCAILESVITKQNGLLLYFKNKRLFWRSILQHNATAQCTYITFEPHLSVKTSHTFSPVYFYTKESSNHASRTPQLVPLKCVYI